MRYRDLTDEIIKQVNEIYLRKDLSWDLRMEHISSMFGVSERTSVEWLKKLGISTQKELESPQFEKAKKRKADPKRKRFLFTWGQSESEPHFQFLENLEAYAKEIGASIHVIAGRYRNPTSLSSSDKIRTKETWHSRLVPYLDAARHNIHKYLTIFSDIKIQPTAVNPMSGMQDVSGINSSIFGSPKVQLQTVPVLDDQRPKLMMTTGACTLPNYTDSKAGKKGEFHHTIGFVIVEIEDMKTFHVRQVTADNDGNFNDLYYDVKDGKVSKYKECNALILGDIHYGQHDEEVIRSTFDLTKRIKPKNIVFHDIFDGYSINHHEMKDPFIQYSNEYHGKNDLSAEIDGMMNFLSQFKSFENVAIVRSNHDDFVDRWLRYNDWRKQPTPKNNKMYMELSTILMEQYESDPLNVIGVIPALIQKKFPSFTVLGKNQSFRINDWELGHHGDTGIHGSRGSLQQFRQLNTKVIVGHYHKPERKDGALSVGTSTKLRLNYNKGPSSWWQSHVMITPNGKAQHILFSRNKNNKLSFTTFSLR